jgi:hypothetical protein
MSSLKTTLWIPGQDSDELISPIILPLGYTKLKAILSTLLPVLQAKQIHRTTGFSSRCALQAGTEASECPVLGF